MPLKGRIEYKVSYPVNDVIIAGIWHQLPGLNTVLLK
jgi:hypothetical protein